MSHLKEDLAGPEVELVETHTSWVFLSPTTAWKIKKPVNYGFLDHTSLEKRKASCDAEVALNARLSQGVYQGVVPVRRDGRGTHAIDGPGQVVDFAVQMVRLPEAARSDVLLAEGQLRPEAIDTLATTIARFHDAMPSGAHITAYGAAECIERNIEENFAQTRDTIRAHLSAEQASEIERAQKQFLRDHSALFEERQAAGKIRDGHGDLRLEHVYFRGDGLEDAPTIIDCIEFNERFRFADVCADVAFLSMDLSRLGRVDLSERFLATYARASNDFDLYRLVDFYEGYRAYVRGKVASILAADTGAAPKTREAAEAEARRYYLLALSAGRESLLRPRVVAVGGLIASGKSTVAERVGERMGAPVVEADRTRKALLGVSETTPLHDSAFGGAYSEETTERVYAELLRRASSVLGSGRPVVLDASFRTRALREKARALAEEHNVPFCFIETRADLETCRARLRSRALAPSVSDGRLEIFDAFAKTWEDVTELSADLHLVLDTSRPLEENVVKIEERLPAWPPGH